MLLLQQPKNKDDYMCIDEGNLNMFLQLRNHRPKYFYNNCYYYKITNKLKSDIKIYYGEYESEVNGFVEGV